MQKQLALHALLDRDERRFDYNEGLADGAEGMAELADLSEGGACVAEGDGFAAMAEGARLQAVQATERMAHLHTIADELPAM